MFDYFKKQKKLYSSVSTLWFHDSKGYRQLQEKCQNIVDTVCSNIGSEEEQYKYLKTNIFDDKEIMHYDSGDSGLKLILNISRVGYSKIIKKIVQDNNLSLPAFYPKNMKDAKIALDVMNCKYNDVSMSKLYLESPVDVMEYFLEREIELSPMGHVVDLINAAVQDYDKYMFLINVYNFENDTLIYDDVDYKKIDPRLVTLFAKEDPMWFIETGIVFTREQIIEIANSLYENKDEVDISIIGQIVTEKENKEDVKQLCSAGYFKAEYFFKLLGYKKSMSSIVKNNWKVAEITVRNALEENDIPNDIINTIESYRLYDFQ